MPRPEWDGVAGADLDFHPHPANIRRHRVPNGEHLFPRHIGFAGYLPVNDLRNLPHPLAADFPEFVVLLA